jgi:micrococcal nuclease
LRHKGTITRQLAKSMTAVAAMAATAASAAILLWVWPLEGVAQSSQPYQLKGKVISVADGDTLTIRGQSNYRVRLASIDAPEKSNGSQRPGQPYSEASRAFLAERVAGKTLTLLCYETDHYDRQICDVPDETGAFSTMNQALVAAGLAWANQQAGGRFLRDDTLLAIQNRARQEKRGLWSEPNPVAPWVWRARCWRDGQCD